MRPQVTLDQALIALANLLNQSTVPSAESSRWQFFVTSAVERLYRSFDLDMALRKVTVTSDANGDIDLAALQTQLGYLPAIESLDDGNTAYPYTFIMGDQSTLYGQGDNKWWLELDSQSPAEWIIRTTQPNGSFTLRFYEAPTISNSQAACFTRMTIAKGALIYYRQAQDPEADTSVEEDQFKQEVSEIMEQQNRLRPQQFIQTRRDRSGGHLGMTD